MAEDLMQMWGNFSLTEEELEGYNGQDESLEEVTIKGKYCLVGKLLVERIVGKESIRSAMVKGWKPTGSVSFKVLGDNLFLIEFKYEEDKLRVLEGRPWFFEDNLFSVAEFDGLSPGNELSFDEETFWIRMFELPLACMGREMGYKLGSTVGVVEEVDTNEEGIGWGKFLRVRLRINITKPLARGRMLRLKERSYWIPFQYEKIPKFCYQCGIIWHGMGGCKKKSEGRFNGDKLEYGAWLCLPPSKRITDRRRRQEGGLYNSQEEWRRTTPVCPWSSEFVPSNTSVHSDRGETSSGKYGESPNNPVMETERGDMLHTENRGNRKDELGKDTGGINDKDTFHMEKERTGETKLGKNTRDINKEEMNVGRKTAGYGKDIGRIDSKIPINEESYNLNVLEECMQGLRSTKINDHKSSKPSKEGLSGSDASMGTARGEEILVGLQTHAKKLNDGPMNPASPKVHNLRTWKKHARELSRSAPSTRTSTPVTPGKRRAEVKEIEGDGVPVWKKGKETVRGKNTDEGESAAAAEQPRRKR
jgi:hypothetical protein